MSDSSDIPIVGNPRGPVLMSAANPNGWKLEELLPQLCRELREKNAHIAADTSPVARAVRANNEVAIGLLTQVEWMQHDTLRALAKLGPDRGPGHPPRIGAGARVLGGCDAARSDSAGS